MTEKAKKYLVDILQAIGLIDDFLSEINGFFEFQEDIKTKVLLKGNWEL